METIKTIKGVNESLWQELRIESVKTKESMGAILNNMLKERYPKE